MKKCWILSGLLLAGLVSWSGCDKEESWVCDKNDADFCSNDGRQIMVCRQGTWIGYNCEDGASCTYIGGLPACNNPVQNAGSACTAGTKSCSGTNIVRSCQTNGTWAFTICNNNQICQAGECVADPNKPIDSDPQIEEKHGIVSIKCGQDGHSVVMQSDDGTTTAKTCLELVGYDAECREYQAGLAGCIQPTSCSDLYTESGSCLGNRRLWCNNDYVPSKPFEEDCAMTGGICASIVGKASCFKACDKPEPKAVSCSDGVVSRCIQSTDQKNVIQTASSLCLDENTSVSCGKNNENVQTACPTGFKCLDETGVCTQLCDESKLNDAQCDENGLMTVCQAAGQVYAYVSVGKRHCLGDTLMTCKLDENDNTYKLNKNNCRTDNINTQGEVVEARCVPDYMVDDGDICMAVSQGEPCNGATNNGQCDGSVLSYCIEDDDVKKTSDCSKNPDGYTVCSVFENFADCRKSCSVEGYATCVLNNNGVSYDINLCAPDQNNGELTMIQGTSICLGNSLYTCDDAGETKIVDCGANGGVCEVNACIYPACSLDAAPICTADNAIVSCQVNASGIVLGTSIQSMACTPDGRCRHCDGGKLIED